MKEVETYIRHALECIILIKAYTKNKSFDDFALDPLLQDAVVRRLEIIGEALNKLPSRIYESNPQIPWREIIGMRNTLIHEYFGINLEWTWHTVTAEVPVLETQLNELVANKP